jgi:N-acetylglucosamine-6-sulfatase
VSRALAAIAVALAVALAATPAVAEAGRQDDSAPPNIVMVVTDDQTLSMLNERTMPETLARIGGEGTTFTDAVATTPLCCPSRAGMLTGQYGHNNGVLDNKYRLLVQKRNLLPVWLSRSGYRTIHVGRYMNGYERVARARTRPAPGWDQWHSLIKPRRYYGYTLSVNGGTVPYGSGPEEYLTSVLGQRSVQMIDRFGPKRRPFYLQVDHLAPHTSGGTENGGKCVGAAIPGPQDEDAFDDEPLPQPPSFNEEDVSDKPSFIRDLPGLDEERVDTLRQRYRCALASLREVDRSVAAIDDALKAVGEKKRTVFIFLSDNGYYYGEHRIPFSKNFGYAEAYRLPLLIRAPRKYLDGAPATTISEPVANIDIAPTILDFARSDPCKKPGGHRCRVMDGRSLLPLLSGRLGQFPNDRGIAIELERSGGVSVDEGGTGTCAYQGIYAPNELYVEHTAALDPATATCAAIDERELYDLNGDPYQLNNVATQSSSLLPPSELQLGLAERLERLKSCAGIKGRDKHQGGRPFCE